LWIVLTQARDKLQIAVPGVRLHLFAVRGEDAGLPLLQAFRRKMIPTMRVPTTPQRSRMMASIRGKNTRPERVLRSRLFAKGLRYRLHVRGLPGSPDLVFPKHRAVIFVHGCFWHRHNGCRYTTSPKSNEDFWRQKFEANIARDRRHAQMLQARGWRLAVVWECALKHSIEQTVQAVEEWLHGGEDVLVIGQSID
jgi:DNA mismatch endonuclease (patch repair protein)